MIAWNLDHPSMFSDTSHEDQSPLYYDYLCGSLSQADPVQFMKNSLWGAGVGDVISQNDMKVFAWYAQLPELARSATAPDPVFGQDGWDLYALHYIWQRNVQAAKNAGEAVFDARKVYLGLSTYTLAQANTAATFQGEDQMLMGMSWLMRRDLRPFFDMWGVTTSSKAAAQVAAYGFAPVPKLYFYRPVKQDGSTYSGLPSVGNVSVSVEACAANARTVPNVPFLYFITPEDSRRFAARRSVTLTVATGSTTGTASFYANGAAIRNCTDLALAPTQFYPPTDEFTAPPATGAQCTWTPQEEGRYTLRVVVDSTQSGYRDPAPAQIAVNVTASPTAPAVSGLSRAAALPGTRVQITGTAFSSVSTIAFNGLPVAFTIDSATQLSITVPQVPSSLVSGYYEVSTAAGYTAFTSSFTVLQAVTGVTLLPGQLVLTRGQVMSLSAVVSPSYASQPGVTWSSSNVSVAAITDAGVVTAGGTAGKAVITVVAIDGGFTASANVSVVAETLQLPVRVDLEAATVDVDVKATRTFSATVLPSTTPYKAVSWSVDDTSIATVNAATGAVSGVALGSTVLRATSLDGGAAGSAILRVVPAVTADDAQNIISEFASGMQYSVENGQLWTDYTGSNPPAAAELAGNMVLQVRDPAAPTIIKSLVFTNSTNPANYPLTQRLTNVTYVSDLPLTIVSNGWDRVAYDRWNGGSGPIALRGPKGVVLTYAKGVGAHANGQIDVPLGGKYVRFRCDVGNDVGAAWYGTIRFSVLADAVSKYTEASGSTSTTVARRVDVDVSGATTLSLKIDDSGDGNAQDQGNWGGAYLVPALTGVVASPRAVALLPGGTASASATISYGASAVTTTTTWTSSNEAVATVSSSGVITAVARGSATVRCMVRMSNADLSVNDTIAVRVTAPAVTELVVSPTSLSLGVSGTRTGQLNATVRADQGADTTVTWTSSNTAVATVSSAGLVTAVAAGGAMITATSADRAFAASVPVYVAGASATAPTAPAAPAVTAGNGAITVRWAAPVFDGGATITGYTATAGPSGKTCTAVPPSTTCSISGLTNGVAQTVTVTASNSAGTSATSAASASIIPRTVPGAPASVTAVVSGEGSVIVSWGAAADGGAVVTAYTVTATPGSRTCATTSSAPAAPAASCVVTGLDTGQSYTFAVLAANEAGAGAASSPSAAVVALGVPGAPRNVTATSKNASAVVTWSEPAATGGSNISGYTVTAKPGGASCTAAGAARTCTVGALTNGVIYTLDVAAVNAQGTGAPTTSAAVTPQTLPGAPTDVTITFLAGGGAADVSWAAPADDGGTPLLGYRVTMSTAGTAAGSCSTSGSSPATACRLYGLTAGTSYTVQVKARNVNGFSAASAPATATAAA